MSMNGIFMEKMRSNDIFQHNLFLVLVLFHTIQSCSFLLDYLDHDHLYHFYLKSLKFHSRKSISSFFYLMLTSYCSAKLWLRCLTSGLYYKHITIVNVDSSVISNWCSKLIDDARVVIYDHNMFIIQATHFAPFSGNQKLY